MTTVRVWGEPDGIKVTTFTSDDPAEIAAVAATLRHDGRVHPEATWLDLAPAALPATLPVSAGYWRHCRLVDGAIHVNRDTMATQVLDQVRQERTRRLAASDGLMLRAQETKQKIAEWRAYRQALRDLPASLDLTALAPGDLEAFTPRWPESPE